MKYFIMEKDHDCLKSPEIVNWFDTINKKDINRESFHEIPKRTILNIKSNEDTIYTDIITRPFLLLSPLVYEISEKYESIIPSKQVILLDKEKGGASLYHLPILEKIDCIAKESELNSDKSKFINPVLLYEKIKNKNIFWAKGFESVSPIVSLDFVESILRRGAVGIYLTEIKLK